MAMILMALIVFGAIVIVGYPLVNAQQYEYVENGSLGNDTFESLASARNTIFDAIRDLEFDHAAGKLSDEDYRQMRARYDVKAAEILQKMDALAGLKKEGANGKPRGVKASTSQASCPRCQRSVLPGDRFCPKCGTPLS